MLFYMHQTFFGFQFYMFQFYLNRSFNEQTHCCIVDIVALVLNSSSKRLKNTIDENFQSC